MMKRILSAAACACLCAPGTTLAAGDDLNALRTQIEALKRTYETQIKALESRLEKAESQAEENRAALREAATETSPPPAVQARRNAFNPALSLILQGSANSYSQDPDAYALGGFQLGDEAGLAPRGMTLDESEMTLSANVDQVFYAQSTFALHDDAAGSEIAVEEAYVDPLALPAGVGARFGRFYSAVGYLNQMHSHAWDFHDEPLAYRAFLGRQYGDDGVRVTWTAPTDLYLMLGGETLAGKSFPAGEAQSVKGDVQTLFVKLGGDIGLSGAWQGGLSLLSAAVHDRQAAPSPNGSVSLFSGDSDLYIADFVYKWAPGGNPDQRNLKLQTELFYRRENGAVEVAQAAAPAMMDYKGAQAGGYAQAIYQFVPHWRVGLRYDRLWADNRLRVSDTGGFATAADVLAQSGLDDQGHQPHRWSLMFDWSPSEFSRLRAQYNRDASRPGPSDNQWMLQYIMTVGSHGAHLF